MAYALVWIVVNLLARVCFRYRAVGAQHVPRTGGVLLAANHESYLDIPLLGCGVRRRLHFLGRRSLFPNPVVGWVCRRLGWIPIRHDRLDREGFSEAIELIRSGKAVVIYPEGTRSTTGALQPAKPGLGVIVAKTGCPVVPVHIEGTFEALPPDARFLRCRPVTVTFGEPMDFTEELKTLEGKTAYQHIAATVMARIAALAGTAPARVVPQR
jgi:1-acyl-sn-glycerol-3-phosphate acyltransferase